MNQRDKDELRGFLENWPASPEAAAVILGQAARVAVHSGVAKGAALKALSDSWDVHARMMSMEARISALERNSGG